jgi:hypothetical protein
MVGQLSWSWWADYQLIRESVFPLTYTFYDFMIKYISFIGWELFSTVIFRKKNLQIFSVESISLFKQRQQLKLLKKLSLNYLKLISNR